MNILNGRIRGQSRKYQNYIFELLLKPQNVIKSEFSFQNDQHNFFKL